MNFWGKFVVCGLVSLVMATPSFAAKGKAKSKAKPKVKEPPAPVVTENDTQFVDPRDEQVYKLEFRGDKVWLASNLKFNTTDKTQCLLDDMDLCKKYGRFYTYDEAKKACPKGWHLPDDGEWRDYQKDRQKLNWKIMGQGGCKDWDGYCDGSITGHYWSATSVKKGTARAWEFRSEAKSINRTDESPKKGLYVRCVTDLK